VIEEVEPIKISRKKLVADKINKVDHWKHVLFDPDPTFKKGYKLKSSQSSSVLLKGANRPFDSIV
jgi:hypothetical protein